LASTVNIGIESSKWYTTWRRNVRRKPPTRSLNSKLVLDTGVLQLSIWDWLTITLISSSVFFADELRKFVRKRVIAIDIKI